MPVSFKKKLLITIASVCVLSAPVSAVIPLTDFKETSVFVHENKRSSLAPILGKAAIESGEIENFRFYGPFVPGIDPKSNRRQYHKDSSDDSMWTLCKNLFPSNAGALNTTANGGPRIGRFITPGAVADFLKYAQTLRDALSKEKNQIENNQKVNVAEITEGFKTKITHALNPKNIEGNMGRVHELSESDKRNCKDAIKVIADLIPQAIALENDGLYPRHYTETLILAFFVQHFNTRADIMDFLLSSQSDKDYLLSEVPSLHESSIEYTPDNHKNLPGKTDPSPEDLYMLGCVDYFTSPIPYANGKPISNGTAQAYDRTTGELLSDSTFADCNEMVLRQVCNMLFFEPKTRAFVLPECVQGGPYAPNLIDFYKSQSPGEVNNGDVKLRSLWSKVVGDMNPQTSHETKEEMVEKKVKYNDPTYPKIKYDKPAESEAFYELTSDFENLMNVLSRLCNTPLKPPFGDKSAKAKWVTESFKTLFQAMHPSYTYTVKMSGFKVNTVMTGKLTVSVFEGQRELFSFEIVCGKGHGEISSIKWPSTTEKLTHLPKAYEDLIKNNPSYFFLLPPHLQKTYQNLKPKSTSPFLDVLAQGSFCDNDRRFTALQGLVELILEGEKEASMMPSNKKNESHFKAALLQSVKNLLDAMSWDNAHVLKKISPLCLEWVKKFPELAKHIKGLDLSDLQNLTSLNVSGMDNLIKLNLSDTGVVEIIGLGDCKNLKILDLDEEVNLTSLDVSELKNLVTLNLDDSNIKEIIGLEKSTSLNNLTLYWFKNLTSIDVTRLTNLKKLHLSGSGFKEIIGLENCEKIIDLDLSDMKNLKTIDVSWMTNLVRLNLSKAVVKEIIGLENCEKLKELYLSNMKNLNSLDVPGLKNLEDLCLEESGVKEIKCLGDCKNLKKLVLSYLENPLTIDATELTKLERIFAEYSPQLNIIGWENLPYLEIIR